MMKQQKPLSRKSFWATCHDSPKRRDAHDRPDGQRRLAVGAGDGRGRVGIRHRSRLVQGEAGGMLHDERCSRAVRSSTAHPERRHRHQQRRVFDFAGHIPRQRGGGGIPGGPDHGVAFRGELRDESVAAGGGGVDGDATLACVQITEQGAGLLRPRSIYEWPFATERIAAPGRFGLDDLGSEIGKEAAAEGHRHIAADL